tara:strand:+ start:4767 stop:6083 length:1317 start_codon:yes stop_codon:yes gene_type:complete
MGSARRFLNRRRQENSVGSINRTLKSTNNAIGTLSSDDGKNPSLSGGVLAGTIGFGSNSLTISSGTLSLTRTATDVIQAKKIIYLSVESGTSDILDFINSSATELTGQLLTIVGNNSAHTITIQHNTQWVTGTDRSILCPGDVDYVITGDEAVDLLYDDTNLNWKIIGKTTGSTSSSWVGTATSNLNMGAFNIEGSWGGTANLLAINSNLEMMNYNIIDVDQVQLTGNSGDLIHGYLSASAGVLNIISSATGGDIDFYVKNSSGTQNKVINIDGASGFTTLENTSLQLKSSSNYFQMAIAGTNALLNSPSGGYDFQVGATTKLALTGTELTVTDNMIINGTTTLGNSVVDTITMNGRINSDIIPATDHVYDLGSSTKRWDDIWLQGDLNFNEGSYGNNEAPGITTGNAIIFLRKQSTGKQQLRVKFESGSSILLAEEV